MVLDETGGASNGCAEGEDNVGEDNVGEDNVGEDNAVGFGQVDVGGANMHDGTLG